jgi:beta-lactamase superfamily II metal-dependent hydrolase
VTTGGEQAAVAGLAGLSGAYTVAEVVPAAATSARAASILESLRAGGSGVLDSAGRVWTWGGAMWWCMPFTASATGQPMCALRVSDGDSSLLVLGDAGSGDQEELCAIYGAAIRADVVVAPPGGAVSPVLLAMARPRLLVVPTAAGGRVAAAQIGVPVARTATQGDVSLVGGSGGFREAA